jgi:hypothetical protein
LGHGLLVLQKLSGCATEAPVWAAGRKEVPGANTAKTAANQVTSTSLSSDNDKSEIDGDASGQYRATTVRFTEVVTVTQAVAVSGDADQQGPVPLPSLEGSDMKQWTSSAPSQQPDEEISHLSGPDKSSKTKEKKRGSTSGSLVSSAGQEEAIAKSKSKRGGPWTLSLLVPYTYLETNRCHDCGNLECLFDNSIYPSSH